MRHIPLLSAALLFAVAVCLVSVSVSPLPARPKPLSLGMLVGTPLHELAVAVGAAPPPAPWDDSPAALGPRTKTSGCRVMGPLPDHACTPGAIFATTTVDAICTPGYTKTVRSVSVKLKKSIYFAYGTPYPQPTGSYEVDHLVPLELGGNNEAANLFPEAAEPRPGFKEKDLVENYLHSQVCDGEMPLPRAQEKIATDWVAVYNSLSQAQLAELRAQYASWADKN